MPAALRDLLDRYAGLVLLTDPGQHLGIDAAPPGRRFGRTLSLRAIAVRPLNGCDRHLRRRALTDGIDHRVDVGELLLEPGLLLLKPGEHLVPVDSAHRCPPPPPPAAP